MKRPPARTRFGNRRGVALLVAIVCVGIAAAVMFAITRLAMQGHRESELRERSLQADWLVHSGADRAAAQLAANPEYMGEKWELGAAELGGRDDAEVRIEVTAIEGQPQWRRVHVVADYPSELPHRVRQSKTYRMQAGP